MPGTWAFSLLKEKTPPINKERYAQTLRNHKFTSKTNAMSLPYKKIGIRIKIKFDVPKCFSGAVWFHRY